MRHFDRSMGFGWLFSALAGLNGARAGVHPATPGQRVPAAVGPKAPSDRVAADLRGWYRRVRDGHEQRRRYRRTVDELSALSDEVLNDIGVRRGDIPAVAARLARVQPRPRHR